MHKFRTGLAIALALTISLPTIAAGRGSSDMQARAVSAAPATPAERGTLIHRFVKKWGPYVEATYGLDVGTWSTRLVPQFAKGDATNLRNAVERGTFEGAMAVMNGAGHRVSDEQVITQFAQMPATSSADSVVQTALGDAEQDLVYTPIQPCRIIDTRNTAAGPIAADGTRSFRVWGEADYTAQGGDSTDCGLGSESPSAVVVNVTAVFPSAAGYATVYPYNATRPLASSVNYAAGAIVNNSITSKLAAGIQSFDMTIYTFAASHYVVDIVGFFDAPRVTALQCTDVTQVLAVAAGARVQASPACPAEYTLTGGGARTVTNDNMHLNASAPDSVNSNAWATSVQNTSGVSKNVTFSARCCRVPGR